MILTSWLWACSGDDGSTTDRTDDTDTVHTATDHSATDTDTDTETPYDPGPNLATTGDAETCLILFGDADRVRGQDDGLPVGTASRTLQAWVRTKSRRTQVALSYGQASVKGGFHLGTHDGYPMVRTSDLDEMVLGDTRISDDAWHHLVAAWNGNLLLIYVDGEVVATEPLEGDTLDGDLVVGNGPTNTLTSPWIGWVDDVKVFDVTRLQAEVQADPEGLSLDSALKLWWDFEGLADQKGPGLTVSDGASPPHDGVTSGTEDTPLFSLCR